MKRKDDSICSVDAVITRIKQNLTSFNCDRSNTMEEKSPARRRPAAKAEAPAPKTKTTKPAADSKPETKAKPKAPAESKAKSPAKNDAPSDTLGVADLAAEAGIPAGKVRRILRKTVEKGEAFRWAWKPGSKEYKQALATVQAGLKEAA